MANSLTVSGSVVASTDVTTADYCLVTGYIQNILGTNLKGTYITFRYFSSISAISPNTLLTGERLVARADSNGKVSIKLLQGTKVKIEIPNRHLDMVKMCNIPSELSADLIDIVFPRVVTVEFSEASKTISVNEKYTLEATATMSDGEEIDVTNQVTFATSNSNIASLEGTSVEGKSTGTATISMTAIDIDDLTDRQEPDGDVIKISGESSPDITDTMDIVVT